ncbi:hypothetical protein J3458_000472 [Metarhizium acridum]|uniref:uncharacterized protein n=1 Tax=Metarhizium acridum TaxID=92637 RepID=UPI001C6AACCB|nr:hypothetical protein J3458_000472 [Metarhizium acridum]
MLVKSATALLAIGLGPLLSSAQFPVTGAPAAANGNVPLRRNVNDLYSEGGPQWDLYIRALASLQSMNASDPLGYFQISGIHGLPFIEWNRGGARNNDGWGGYCPHGEALFLPWHRPFVLLFEQLLVEHAVGIASQYPARYRGQYMAAANNLRSPYWDWSADSNVPPCTVPERVSVNIPNGQNLRRIEIRNPLSTYKYPREALDGEFGEFSKTPQMARCPDPGRYPDSANQELQDYRLKQATYDIFTTASNFHQFAVRGRVHHLEELHNDVHYSAACKGQFFDAELSGFEPLFMLHHTQVDRLWAYWQFIDPSQASFSGSYRGQSRFSTPQGTIINQDSPLQPFSDRKLRYHTPRSVSSIKGMGYTYEGLEHWRKSAAQLRQDSIQTINSLYAPPSAFAKRGGSQAKTRHFAHVELDRAQVERPCSVKVFIAGKRAGTIPVMLFPANGNLRSSLSIDAFLTKGSSSNGTLEAIEHLVQVEISKADGTVIPLDKVDSLNITLEQASITPAASRNDFPKITDMKEHAAKIQAYSKS